MRVHSLGLFDFRNYSDAELVFDGELTVLIGANGQGKTNLLEAVGMAAGLGSIRGVPHSALVRQGADSAVIRCCSFTDAGREMLIETQISSSGRNRTLINRQPLDRRRHPFGAFAITVFSPDDLMLVKGSPAGRRRWIDTALTSSQSGFGACRSELERILRQRNALLRQISGRLDSDAARTLDVWDAKLSETGDEVRRMRVALLKALSGRLKENYEHLAGAAESVAARYESSWGSESLAEALVRSRGSDLRRAVSTVGPHRDDVELAIRGMPARTHASQGEQRSLALALRLAVDAEIREQRQERPILLLDDVFSELDTARSSALLELLPEGQRIITSTDAMLPIGALPDQLVSVYDGSLRTDRRANTVEQPIISESTTSDSL